MKKLLIAMLVISLLLLGLSSCGGDDTPENTPPTTNTTPDPTPGSTENPPSGSVNPPDEEKTKFTITWMNENGTSIGTTSVEEGTVPSQTYSVTDTAEWDYTFHGWATTQGGDVLSSIPAASANATYYAVVSAVKQTYTVTFNSVGGSAVAPQTVEYGSTATMPENPRKDGFKFAGWSTSATEVVAVDFATPITGNVEYFAVWSEVVYTVKWLNENGALLSSASVKEGAVPVYTYSVTDTAEWDYTFVGWSKTANGEVLASIPAATENATYYAVVSAVKQTYTVTFNSVGGSAVAPQTVEYGSTATMPENPRKDGFKFAGWSTSATEANAVDFNTPITGNVEYFAVWNEVVDVKALLSALLSGYQFNPYYYIPEAMRMDYSANLVDPDDIITDYSGSVRISDITYGFGEQWYMVLDNLHQTNAFFNVLSVVETLSTTSITAFNNYFDKNPANTAHHEFTTGIYNVTIDFDGEIIYYVLDYTTNVPVFGEQTIQIALAMYVETGDRVVRIQAGDANALTYTVTENSYEFAIKYLGVRRALFTIERTDDGITGTINEFLGVGSAMISSAADFYITDDYVSVVGNKASGMVLFTGYICELYSTETGKMCGYEVKETLSKVEYDTLWFLLSDIGGLTSIRYQEETDSTDAAFFVNGSSTAWKAKKNILTRRFDIEFRTQYVYSYDPSTDEYTVHEIQVPMLFVQEDNFDTLIDDVQSTNKINISVEVAEADLTKVMSDYDALIPVFIERKDLITPEIIVAYIGEKITFEVE